jgi:hypothetical protein
VKCSLGGRFSYERTFVLRNLQNRNEVTPWNSLLEFTSISHTNNHFHFRYSGDVTLSFIGIEWLTT